MISEERLKSDPNQREPWGETGQNRKLEHRRWTELGESAVSQLWPPSLVPLCFSGAPRQLMSAWAAGPWCLSSRPRIFCAFPISPLGGRDSTTLTSLMLQPFEAFLSAGEYSAHGDSVRLGTGGPLCPCSMCLSVACLLHTSLPVWRCDLPQSLNPSVLQVPVLLSHSGNKAFVGTTRVL